MIIAVSFPIETTGKKKPEKIRASTGFEPVTSGIPVGYLPVREGFFFPVVSIGKLTAMIILHFHLQPQFIYELFHINFTSFHSSREDMNSIN